MKEKRAGKNINVFILGCFDALSVGLYYLYIIMPTRSSWLLKLLTTLIYFSAGLVWNNHIFQQIKSLYFHVFGWSRSKSAFVLVRFFCLLFFGLLREIMRNSPSQPLWITSCKSRTQIRQKTQIISLSLEQQFYVYEVSYKLLNFL